MEFLTPAGGKNLLNSAFCTLHSAFEGSILHSQEAFCIRGTSYPYQLS